MTRPNSFGSPAGGARALLGQGVAAQRAGDLAAAEKLFRAAVKLDRDDAEAHHLLAALHLAMRRHRDALEDIARAIKLDDRHPSFHATKGNIHFAMQDWAHARKCYERSARLDPRSPHAWFNAGLAAEKAGDPAGAEQAYLKSVECDSRSVRALNALAILRFDSRRFDEAREWIERALAVAPGLHEIWNTAGNIARAQFDFKRAAECFERVVALTPTSFAGHMNLGQVLREAGRVDEAVVAYRRALEMQPDQPQVHVVLAMSVKFRERNAEVEWLERAVAEPHAHAIDEDELIFALAKVYTDLGKDDAAFDLLVRGNAIKRSKLDWTIEIERTRFERIRQYYNASSLRRLAEAGDVDASPIFVLGMPRSGTSLVEQILASHPLVHGAGELTAVDQVCARYPELRGDDGGDPVRLDSGVLRRAAAEYLAHTRALAPDKPWVVDKMPGNFVNLGAIALMFPRARIVHCIRDARDNCYSIFRQNFSGLQAFAYDLEELGSYYLLYEQLMEHWRTVLPAGRILDFRHEDLLDDFEPQVRRLLDYVGLEFEERCVRFHETERIVRTASIMQVRQPLFRTSLGQWRKHEDRLGPLLSALGPR